MVDKWWAALLCGLCFRFDQIANAPFPFDSLSIYYLLFWIVLLLLFFVKSHCRAFLFFSGFCFALYALCNLFVCSFFLSLLLFLLHVPLNDAELRFLVQFHFTLDRLNSIWFRMHCFCLHNLFSFIFTFVLLIFRTHTAQLTFWQWPFSA